MNPTLAKISSWVFHPIFIPLYSLVVILYSFPFHYQYIPDKIWNITIITMFLMTMLFPALIMLIFKKLNIVGDYDISEQKERIFPYLIFVFFYLLSFLTFRPKDVSSIVFMEDPLIATVILGATLSLFMAFFLNNFLKVSMHTVGVTNLFVFCCLISCYTQKNIFFIILLSLIILGLVGSSRIFLKAHTVREVYYGFFSGALGQILAFSIYFTNIK